MLLRILTVGEMDQAAVLLGEMRKDGNTPDRNSYNGAMVSGP